jgi:hypothetical protein
VDEALGDECLILTPVAAVETILTGDPTRKEKLPMPTVFRAGRFRFFFYSNEGEEPPHIHVKAGDDEAKFWLFPVDLAVNYGFNQRELNDIHRLVEEHQDGFLEAWNEYFAE